MSAAPFSWLPPDAARYWWRERSIPRGFASAQHRRNLRRARRNLRWPADAFVRADLKVRR